MPEQTWIGFRLEDLTHQCLDARAEIDEDLTLAYDIFGEKDAPEKVLMIMGFMTPRDAWYSLVETLLRKQPKRYQLLCFDNRGIGQSSCPRGRYTTSCMADDAMRLVDYLGWDAVHVIGISMGGMISQEVVLHSPKRILSLSLLVTHAGGRGAFPGRYQLSGYLSFASMIFNPKNVDKNIDGTLSLLFTRRYLDKVCEGSDRTNREVMRETMKQKIAWRRDRGVSFPMSSILKQLMAVHTHRCDRHRCELIRQQGYPILIVGASRDNLIHPRNSELLAKKLESDHTKFVVLTAGHGIFEEENEECAQLVLENMAAAEDKDIAVSVTPSSSL